LLKRLDPNSTATAKQSARPARAAHIATVKPDLSRASTSTPEPNNTRRLPGLPSVAAHIDAVFPS
jgi:hypothetical protein